MWGDWGITTTFTFSPKACSSANAASFDIPTTFGMGKVLGPLETIMTIVEPFGRIEPAGGFVPMTKPEAIVAEKSCFC